MFTANEGDTVAPSRPALFVPLLSIFSAICLQLSLLTGLAWGVRGPAFVTPWAIHVLLLLAAGAAAAGRMCTLVQASSKSVRVLFAAAVLLSLGYILAAGGLPITARDALIHHVAVPRWWLQENEIFFPPWHEWSFYPMLLQLGFTGFMRFRGTALTPFYHAIYLLLLAALAADFAARRGRRADAGLAAAAILILVPVNLKLASVPLVDLGLAYFCGLACFLSIEAVERRKTSVVLLAGASWGVALSIKFNAIPAFGIFFFLWFLFMPWNKERAGTVLRWFALAGCAALLVYLPWLAKNYYHTANPFFPLFKGFFGPAAAPVSAAAADLPGGLTWLQQRRWLYQESWLEILLIPLRIFFQGRDEVPALFDGRLTPVLLLALVPLFLTDKFKNEKLLAWFSAAYILAALVLGGGRVRYLAPVMGPMSALAALGVSVVAEKLRKRPMKIGFLPVVLVFQLVWTLHYAISSLDLGTIAAYYSGRISKEQYLEKTVPDYAAISYINRELPADAKVYLLLTGNRFFYFERPVISPGHYSGNQVLLWLGESQSAEDFRRELASRGIAYLMAHVRRTSEHLGGNLRDEKKLIWNDFQKRFVTPRFEANGYVVWEIKQ